MDEATWIAAANPTPMLEFLRDKASDRKLRLFAVACCRGVWASFTDQRSRKAIEAAEKYADDWASVEELFVAHEAANAAASVTSEALGAVQVTTVVAIAAAELTARATRTVFAHFRYRNAPHVMVRGPTGRLPPIQQATLIRCIFSNPFRPVVISPNWRAWNDGTLVMLAQAIYEERALPSGYLDAGRLAIMADALEEAGCHDDGILDHLRGASPHVRGCHVVDALLGKE